MNNCRKCGYLLAAEDVSCPNCGQNRHEEVKDSIKSLNQVELETSSNGGQLSDKKYGSSLILKDIKEKKKEEKETFTTAAGDNQLEQGNSNNYEVFNESTKVKVKEVEEPTKSKVTILILIVSFILVFISFINFFFINLKTVTNIIIIITTLLSLSIFIYSLVLYKKKKSELLILSIVMLIINILLNGTFLYLKGALKEHEDRKVYLSTNYFWRPLKTNQMTLRYRDSNLYLYRKSLHCLDCARRYNYDNDSDLSSLYNDLKQSISSSYNYLGGSEDFINLTDDLLFAYSDFEANGNYARYYYIVSKEKNVGAVFMFRVKDIKTAENYNEELKKYFKTLKFKMIDKKDVKRGEVSKPSTSINTEDPSVV